LYFILRDKKVVRNCVFIALQLNKSKK
jgi:hypothetical protein